MGAGCRPKFRKELDSLQVELLDGEVQVRARLRTARLPRELRRPAGGGPAAERAGARPPVRCVSLGPGAGEWAVRSFRIRDIPVPASAVPRLVSRALDEPGRETVPWTVPAGVRAIRIRSGGATLYGAPRP